MMDSRVEIRSPHNHEANVMDLNKSFLRNAMGESGLQLTNSTTSVRTICNNEIHQ